MADSAGQTVTTDSAVAAALAALKQMDVSLNEYVSATVGPNNGADTTKKGKDQDEAFLENASQLTEFFKARTARKSNDNVRGAACWHLNIFFA